MTYQASTAYACVAFRIMEHEGSELTEEYLEILMGVLYDFYTADEIQKIYTQGIVFDSCDAVMNDMIIKKKINEQHSHFWKYYSYKAFRKKVEKYNIVAKKV